MTTTAISFVLDTTDALAALGFEGWIDNHKFIDLDHVSGPQTVTTEVDDIDAEHELRFVLKNKTDKHTRINESGNILADACVTINQLSFDEIELKQIFIDHAIYAHDFNGTGATIEDQFYGTMGCNGAVTLKFTTPIYLWLLEHM